MVNIHLKLIYRYNKGTLLSYTDVNNKNQHCFNGVENPLKSKVNLIFNLKG